MTRKRKRELEEHVSALESDGLARAGWITLLSADRIETIPGSPDTVRVDGEVKRLMPEVQESLGGYQRA